MTDSPIDNEPSPSVPRLRVGIIGHVSRDKSSLVAALSLINRHEAARQAAEVPTDRSNAFAAARAPKASKSEDAPLPDWEGSMDRRASWKAQKEDARRSNRRGRRPRP